MRSFLFDIPQVYAPANEAEALWISNGTTTKELLALTEVMWDTNNA
jgi:hypothetical protein